MKDGKELLEDFAEFCHEHYNGCVDDNYLYDNEIVWLVDEYLKSKEKEL